MFPFDPEESNSLPPSLPPPPSSLLSFEFSMANPNHTAVVGDPPTIGEYVRELPRAVVMDYVKSPPRFLLHFVLGGLLFYLQLEAGREGKNQRWFQLGLLLTTLAYLLICALPTVLAFLWRRHGNLSICQLCGGF